MFDLIAGLLAFFYERIHSYALSIALLTLIFMVAFTPLILRSTKSMLEMRALQPKLKKLQAKYADDRQLLQQEQMKLYQQHGVNPVSGCLPMLFQAPVFLVLYRVIAGLTRRTLPTGFATGNGWFKRQLALDFDIAIPATLDKTPAMRFNPAYLDHSSQMYRDLASSTQMKSLGIDLSRSASEMVGQSFTAAIPYLVLVVVVGILSLYQNRQIQGRNTGAEMNPQMEMITKIMPWFLPVFAFTLPAAMCVYFFTQSVVRVGQQAYITRRFYGEDSPFTKNAEEDDDDDDEDENVTTSEVSDDVDDASSDADAGPDKSSSDKSGSDKSGSDKNGTAPRSSGSRIQDGVMGVLMGNTQDSAKTSASSAAKHGSRAPVTTRPRRRANTTSRTTPKATPTKSTAKSGGTSGGNRTTASAKSSSTNAKAATEESGGLWARARRRAAEAGGETSSSPQKQSSSSKARAERTSKRVTPKSDDSSKSKRK